MNATLTRPAGIPAEIIASTDKQLKALLGTPFAPHAELEIEFRTANAEALALIEAEALEARREALMTEGATILGMKVSYSELLQLATLGIAKKWYEMPEGNIVSRLHDEVASALKGIQSREANALKQAIADNA